MVARNNNADLYVSLHINDMINTNVNGANVYVTNRTELPKYKEKMTVLGNKILNNLNKIGIKNNGVINDKLCNDREPKYQYYDGSQADYYADIRCAMKGDTEDSLGIDFRDGSGIPTVLIEHCYMNNNYDVQFLDSEEDLRKLAKADAEAIIEFLGLKLPKDVIKIDIDKESINIIQGQTKKVTAIVTAENSENKEVKWTSNNEKIAKVDQKGNITAIGVGKANIKVTSIKDSNVSKTILVNIEEEEIEFIKEIDNILLGKTKKLELEISPSWEENKNIIWESSNKEIVEVINTGKITAKKAGTADITATWQDKKLSAKIKINVIELSKDTKIEINKYKINDNKISKIGPKVKIEDFISNIELSDNLTLEIKTRNEKQEYVGTNTKIIIKEKEHDVEVEEYECLIYGDINGDGKISSLDYTIIKNHIMDVQKITNNNMQLTSDINGDGKISSLDYTIIKNDIMDVQKMTLK